MNVRAGKYFKAPDLTIGNKVVRFAYGVIYDVHKDFAQGIVSVYVLFKSDVGMLPSASPDSFDFDEIKVLSKEEYDMIIREFETKEVIEK